QPRQNLVAAIGDLIKEHAAAARRINRPQDIDVDLVLDEAARIARRLVEIDDAGILGRQRIELTARDALQAFIRSDLAEGTPFGKGLNAVDPDVHRAAPRLPRGSLLRRLANGDAFVGEQLLQFARLEHLADDVATADELALDVELRNGRPVREGLDAVAELIGVENVEALVGHANVIENLHHLGGKSAHWELRRSFHEQHDVVRLHFIFDELLDAHD